MRGGGGGARTASIRTSCSRPSTRCAHGSGTTRSAIAPAAPTCTPPAGRSSRRRCDGSGVDPQDGLADRLAGRYRALRDESIAALPGALQTLDDLRAAGFRLGLITNGAADVQRAKIDRFDLARHFDYIGIEGERGFGKPDPRAYRAALDALGCRPEDAWMAGDRLDWDVLAPMEAGIAGVWVNPADLPADGAEAGYRIVRTIAELVDGVSPT